jgi:hypothetical protein
VGSQFSFEQFSCNVAGKIYAELKCYRHDTPIIETIPHKRSTPREVSGADNEFTAHKEKL